MTFLSSEHETDSDRNFIKLLTPVVDSIIEGENNDGNPELRKTYIINKNKTKLELLDFQDYVIAKSKIEISDIARTNFKIIEGPAEFQTRLAFLRLLYTSLRLEITTEPHSVENMAELLSVEISNTVFLQPGNDWMNLLSSAIQEISTLCSLIIFQFLEMYNTPRENKRNNSSLDGMYS